jgi:hypothetical protein
MVDRSLRRRDLELSETCMIQAGRKRSRSTVCGALASLVTVCLPFNASAIVGGTPDASESSQSLVRVGSCSGVLVAADVVLTAGHCDSEFIIWRDVNGGSYAANKQARAAAPAGTDLALMKLVTPVAVSTRPATLSMKVPWLGEPVSVIGYGQAVPGKASSAGTLRSATLSVRQPLINDGLSVWADNGGTAGACTGDSGGALRLGTSVFAIVTSILGPCGTVTIGVLLGPQRDWIDQTLAAWGRTAGWDLP